MKFEFEGKNLRVSDSGVWFNAFDLGSILGIRDYICYIPEEAKKEIKGWWWLNEDGVWALVYNISVDKKIRKKVAAWLRDEVFETIDKPKGSMVQVFENAQFGKVRTLIKEDEPWFVGKDVAEVLGYADGFGAIKKHVDEEDKQNCQNSSFESPRGMTIINESGLYSLILSSKLPAAKKFKHWVTADVLPALRKTGKYQVENQASAIQMIMQRFDKLEVKLIEDKPKVEFYDKMMASEGSVRMDVLANVLAKNGVTKVSGKPIGRNSLYELLRDRGWLTKDRIVDGYGKKIFENRPTQQAIERGLFERIASHNHGVLSYTVYVTIKGIDFFTKTYL